MSALRIYWATVTGGPGGPVRWTATIRDRTEPQAQEQALRRAIARGLKIPLTVYVDDIGSSDDTELDRDLNPWIYEDRK